MRKIISLFILVAVLSFPVYAAPLIYKGVVLVNNEPLGGTTPVINTARYNQIRVYVALKSGYLPPIGDPLVSISAVEDRKFFILGSFDSMKMRESILIDTPPSAIQIHINVNGQYSVYVWGS